MTSRGLLRMAVFGAVVGSVLDGFHTHGSMTSYPQPVVWMMAWWTPLIFAVAYTLLGLGYELVHPADQPSPLASTIGFIAFGGLYFVSGFLPAFNATKVIVLLVGAFVLWLALDRTWRTIALAIFAAILGPTTEIILVHLGAFVHLKPDFAGIPMWLPALYVSSATGAAPFMAWVGRK